MKRLSPQDRFLLGGVALLGAYAVAAAVLLSGGTPTRNGPLSLHQPQLRQPLPGAVDLSKALEGCFSSRDPHAFTYKLVGGLVGGQPYYACYELYRDDGSVSDLAVVDGDGFRVDNSGLLKRGGAWPWIATVKSGRDLALTGAGMAALLGLAFAYYHRARPSPPPDGGRGWTSTPTLWLLILLLPVIGWVVVALQQGLSKARKRRLLLQGVLVYTAVILFGVTMVIRDRPDSWGLTAAGFLGLAYLYGVLAGRFLLAPPGFGVPEPPPPGVVVPAWAGTWPGAAGTPAPPPPPPPPGASVPASASAAPGWRPFRRSPGGAAAGAGVGRSRGDGEPDRAGAGNAAVVRRRRRDAGAQAGAQGHHRADARLCRGGRGVPDHLERAAAAWAAGGRQDLLRAGDRRGVRAELRAGGRRRPGVLVSGRVGPKRPGGVPLRRPAGPLRAVLRRVRLGRAAPRRPRRPGGAPYRQPAARIAGGVPVGPGPGGGRGDQRPGRAGRGGDPAGPLRPAHPRGPARPGGARGDLQGAAA